MPHVTFVTLSGFRVCRPELYDLGLTLPGFQDRANALSGLPALGLITLAGMLPENWSSSYFAPSGIDEEFLLKVVLQKPDLVAISALTPSIIEAYQLCEQLHKFQINTVIGGLHVSVCAAEATKHADAIVVGSGELIWSQLLRDAERHTLKPVYRAGRNQIETDWPLPAYHLLGDVQRYTIQTQRGCPFACDFCAASRLIEGFREKPVENIQQELAAIAQLKSNALIELADDNTFAGSRDIESFLDVMENANVRWFTESDWRLGERPDLLKRLASSGCVQVLVGLESLIFRYPGMSEKSVELNRMLDACSAIQDAGVCVNGCFIVGAEGETEKSMERLTDFLLQSSLAEVQVTLQTPFPGTALYHRLKKSGRLLEGRDWRHYTLFDVTYQPDLLSVHQLESSFEDLIQNVYGSTATARRKQIRRDVWRKNTRLSPTISGQST